MTTFTIEFSAGGDVKDTFDKTFDVDARLVWFCDKIDTNTGWVTTNGGGQLLIDDPSFPDKIHFESLAGGGGVTETWTRKDIGRNLSGDIKLEFFFDFQSMKPTDPRNPSEFRIFLQEQVLHPDNSTGSRIGCILTQTNDFSHHLYGRVDDGTSVMTSIQGGSKNQKTTPVYPTTGVPGGVDAEVLGPYWITVELKNNKFRMSIFKDEDRTIHARGSPREVDATGINPTNLRYLTISNSKGASSSFSLTTADIDDIYITQNEPLPSLAVNTTTQVLVEDWESYAEFIQNPSTWLGDSTQLSFNGGLFDPFTIDIKEVSSEQPNGGTKAYKLHTKYQHLASPVNGTTESVAGVIDKKILTPPNPDGGELLVPYQFSSNMRADILSPIIDTTGLQLGTQAGVYIMYDVIGGAPLQDVGSPPKSIFWVLFQGPDNDESSVRIFNGTSFPLADASGAPQQALPFSSYTELKDNIADVFNNNGSFDNMGLDFESHVKSISIGYFTYCSAGGINAGNVEALVYGDEINLLPEDVELANFTIDAQLKENANFTVNAIISNRLPFTIDSLVGNAIDLEFTINGRVVFRNAVNNVTPDALIQLQDIGEDFLIDGLTLGALLIPINVDALITDDGIKFTLVDSFIIGTIDEIFTLDAQLVHVEQTIFTIDGLIKSTEVADFTISARFPFVNQTLFTVDAIMSTRAEFTIDSIIDANIPQSILFVESVLGQQA